MMNVGQIEKELCCGCTACASACKFNAITMRADKEGFLYPVVDSEQCTNCGQCVQVCTSKATLKSAVVSAYAAKNTDMAQLMRSSSGGVSRALCTEVICSGGVVYGVRYNEHNEVINYRAATEEACDSFYGSKYVQTNPLNTFREVEKDLKDEKKVLFFGTSCHIAGLLRFLQANRVDVSKLYTVDLICHGVPSPRLFRDYINFLSKKSEVDHVAFRTKALPWGYGSKNFGCTVFYKNGHKEIGTARAWIFLLLFFSNNCLRPHCHRCDFATVDKPSDMTIADYWGCKEEELDFFDENGVSAILVHSKKGEELLTQCASLKIKKTSVDKISKHQGNLLSPSLVSDRRELFWETYFQFGFAEIAKRYGGYNFKGKIRRTRLYKIYLSIRGKAM